MLPLVYRKKCGRSESVALEERKIAAFAKPVSSLPDQPSQAGYTAAEVKAAFDSNAEELRQAMNGLIDDLVGEELPNKMDKDKDAAAGNFAVFDAEGNPVDSGKKPEDFEKWHHAHENKSVIDGIKEVTRTLGEATDRVPSEKAVKDALHGHENKAVLDGIQEVTQTLGNAANKVPSEAAAKAALQEAVRALEQLIAKETHDHGNKAVLDGIQEVTQILGNAANKVPSEAAVSAAMKKAGMGDMMSEVYDPQGKNTDMFAYVDEAAKATQEQLQKVVREDFMGYMPVECPYDSLAAGGNFYKGIASNNGIDIGRIEGRSEQINIIRNSYQLFDAGWIGDSAGVYEFQVNYLYDGSFEVAHVESGFPPFDGYEIANVGMNKYEGGLWNEFIGKLKIGTISFAQSDLMPMAFLTIKGIDYDNSYEMYELLSIDSYSNLSAEITEEVLQKAEYLDIGLKFAAGAELPAEGDILRYMLYQDGNGAWEPYGVDVEVNEIKSFGDEAVNFYSRSTTEPLKEEVVSVNFGAPLRSLPNGVCDTYENGAITRRVGVDGTGELYELETPVIEEFAMPTLASYYPNTSVHHDSTEASLIVWHILKGGGKNADDAEMSDVRGYNNAQTVFNADGSITETFADGVQVTTFNEDGSIVTVFKGADGKVLTKTVTFNADGSITEVVE